MTCALCNLSLPKSPIQEGPHAFCCAGCQTVYRILSSQQVSGTLKDHPLFAQALEAGIISNPQLHEELKSKEAFLENHEKSTLHFEINQMWCPSCAQAIQWVLQKEKGVLRCVVDYATDLAFVEYAPRFISKESIFDRVKRLGYAAQPFLAEDKKEGISLWSRIALALFCAMNLMMFSYPLYSAHFGENTEGYENIWGWLSLVTATPLITYCAWPIWKRLWVGVRTGFFGMETLIMIGVLTAFTSSTIALTHGNATGLYYDSMSMILVFVLLGKMLEKRAKFSAKEALVRLTRSLPKKARRFLDDRMEIVSIYEIKTGDIVVTFPGEKIVLDGEVVRGEGICNESLMTGESRPITKHLGSAVLGGSLLQSGTLHSKVKATASDSMLSRLLATAEKELGKKRNSTSLIDRTVKGFVPFVIILAFASGIYFQSIERALAVLLISCPCAIGIAAPLVEALWLGRMLSKGFLVRNRNALPLLSKPTTFVLDKTGTLTLGEFQILRGLETLSDEEKSLLKGLAVHSQHPISEALNRSLSTIPASFEQCEEIIGKGVRGILKGKSYFIGSAEWLRENGVEIAMLEPNENTLVYFGNEHELLAKIELGDKIREKLPDLSKTLLLSGDQPTVVAKVANHCKISDWRASCTPLEKRAEIERLKKNHLTVVMVGDGINDLPALAAADVGISVAPSSDLSAQMADLLLSPSHLENLSLLHPLAKRAQSIIRQNLFWAFIYNIVGMGLAFFGLLTPFFAALAMIASSLCVSLNSLRLKNK